VKLGVVPFAMAILAQKNFLRLTPLGAAVLILAGGCTREDRNFETGGPQHVGPSDFRTPSENVVPSIATGPQTSFEENAYALSEGKRLYGNFNCVGCHAYGGGDIGPALMDARWLYGATPPEIFTSIMEGRPNGMPAFRGRITETQARQLTAYVRSLSGQASRGAATSRDDHMKTSAPENSAERAKPEMDPQRSSVFQK
jgi:cytochrome c oxidase cbb3-type subunit 3